MLLCNPKMSQEDVHKHQCHLESCFRSEFSDLFIIQMNPIQMMYIYWTNLCALQIVCSFLARDMGIDWRMGAEWFETCLLDYDPASNYGNWTYGAG